MSQIGMWVFEELRGAAVRRDPNEGELFKSEQAAEGEYAGNDALVREILQNSLDARSGESPVRVRLAIYEAIDAPPVERLRHYFSRLEQPVQSRGVEFDVSGCPSVPCRFLVCEDFGTRGLAGDVLRFKDPSPSDTSRQDFYWFWRNIGRSGKTGDDLGRWGLGKTVYRSASRMGCMFGLTIRESDQQRLMMGQAVLHIHSRAGKEFMPEGYWCASQAAEGLPLPIDASIELERFSAEWKLTRKNEPGLSVVSPFVHPDLNGDRVLQAVLVHFFLPILRGELIVEVAGRSSIVRLTADSLRQVCGLVKWDGSKRSKRHMAPPVTFAKESLALGETANTELLGRQKLPEINANIFPEESLHQLRRDFADGELISIRVNMWLPEKSGSGKQGELTVYLRRPESGGRTDTYYIREGMTITKLNSRAASRGIESLVIVDSGPLAELLGDTEGPAHEDWETSAERPDRNWKTWKGRVSFTRRIVDGLVELLTPPVTEPDFDLLSDFFSIDRTGDQKKRKPGNKKKLSAQLEAITPVPKWYAIISRSGGFTLKRNSDVPRPDSTALKVSIAYDIPRGNPLRNWSPFDFEISRAEDGIRPTGQRASVRLLAGNIVIVRPEADDFRISMDGFDQNRDLFVRVDEVPDPGEEE